VTPIVLGSCGLASFCVAAGVAVVFAGLMLVQTSLYASAICLLVTLIQIGALFYLFGFQLLAFLQVIIYAGAVMVLLVEGVMAAPPAPSSRYSHTSVPKLLVLLAPVVLFLELGAWGLLGAPSQPLATLAAPQSARLAALLFGRYAVLTEAVGLLILLSALSVIETGKAWDVKK
jgi:NADH-quinone oxidoreductase subunit J